jgi:hypothetical protein
MVVLLKKVIPILEYYLFNKGGSLPAVINATFNVNLTNMLQQLDSSRSSTIQVQHIAIQECYICRNCYFLITLPHAFPSFITKSKGVGNYGLGLYS